MFRKYLALILGLALAAMGGGSAMAQGAITNTVVLHDEVVPIFDTMNPCFPVIGTGVVNTVFHQTITPNGSEHFTGTFAGSIDVEEVHFGTTDPTGRTATGHATATFGGNVNVISGGDGVKLMERRTFQAQGTLSDGSQLNFGFVVQFRQDNPPSGDITLDSFKLRCTSP